MCLNDSWDFPCSAAMREINTEPRTGWPSIMYLENRIKKQQKEIDRLHLLLGMRLLEPVRHEGLTEKLRQQPEIKERAKFKGIETG